MDFETLLWVSPELFLVCLYNYFFLAYCTRPSLFSRKASRLSQIHVQKPVIHGLHRIHKVKDMWGDARYLVFPRGSFELRIMDYHNPSLKKCCPYAEVHALYDLQQDILVHLSTQQYPPHEILNQLKTILRTMDQEFFPEKETPCSECQSLERFLCQWDQKDREYVYPFLPQGISIRPNDLSVLTNAFREHLVEIKKLTTQIRHESSTHQLCVLLNEHIRSHYPDMEEKIENNEHAARISLETQIIRNLEQKIRDSYSFLDTRKIRFRPWLQNLFLIHSCFVPQLHKRTGDEHYKKWIQKFLFLTDLFFPDPLGTCPTHYETEYIEVENNKQYRILPPHFWETHPSFRL